jgi:hypothetical protein
MTAAPRKAAIRTTNVAAASTIHRSVVEHELRQLQGMPSREPESFGRLGTKGNDLVNVIPRLRFALPYPAALLSSCKRQPSPSTANGCLENRIGLVALYLCLPSGRRWCRKGQRKRRNQAGRVQNLICRRRARTACHHAGFPPSHRPVRLVALFLRAAFFRRLADCGLSSIPDRRRSLGALRQCK